MTNLPGRTSQPLQGEPWQRLSYIAILYFVMAILRGVISNIVYLIPVLAYSYSNIREQPFIWLPALAVLFVILIGAALWRFMNYRFRLNKRVVEIRSGIFSKKHLNLPFDRIQNVRIEQPIYYRLTGYACLELDTAGSVKQEANLVALPLSMALALKQKILTQKAPLGDQETTNLTSQETSNTNSRFNDQEELLNRRCISDLILHGITHNRIWILLGGLLPFLDNIAAKITPWLSQFGFDFNGFFSLQSRSFVEVGFYTLSITIMLICSLMLLSVFGAIISFYGYTLSKSAGRYIKRSGLFTKNEVSMPLSRLQLVIQQQDWLDSLLKRVNLRLEQSTTYDTQNDVSTMSNKLVVPSITVQQSRALIADLYPNNQLFTIQFSHISAFYLVRYIGFFLIPLFFIVQIIAWRDHDLFLSAIAIISLGGLSALFYLRWRRWGYGIDDNYLYLRKGLFGIDYYCFPLFKVQQGQLQQSVMMKRRQLASIKYILASGSLTLPLLPESVAFSMLNSGINQVISSQRSWM